jgi:large subunit ribosomal protein L6
MSRVGKKPIVVPKDVKISIRQGEVEVQGPKGKLKTPIPPGISFEVKGGELLCTRTSDERQHRAYHGLARALAQNAVTGVTTGFTRELDIVGVGYKAAVEGKKVVFALGYSHAVEYVIPEGIKIAIDKQTHLVVTGSDRQQVGQVAAEIRSLRKPDRYMGEVLKKKAGKAGATGGAK